MPCVQPMSMLPEIPTDRVAALRARLERQHEMLVGLIRVLSPAEEESIGDHLFRALGIVAFWQALPCPGAAMVDQVNRALDQMRIEKVQERTP